MIQKNPLTVPTKYFVAFFIFFLAMIYFLLVPRYMIFNLDDAWTTSLVYNYHYNNELTDIVFGGPGLLQFGRVHAYLYGGFLSFFDYSWESSLYFSMLLVISALVVTYMILIKLAFNKEVAMISIIILLAMEPIIAIAHTARPDALNFLLVTLIILFWTLKKPLLSGLLFGLGATIHPMFVIAIPYVISVAVYQYLTNNITKVDLKNLILLFLTGTGVSFSLYVFIHWNELNNTLNVINQSSNRLSLDIFIKYYLEAKFFRHLPELAILMITIFFSIYVIRRSGNRFLIQGCLYGLMALVLVILSLIVIGRNNHYYMVYLMPALSLQMTLIMYSMIKQLVYRRLLIIGLLGLYLLPLTYPLYVNYDANFSHYVKKLNAILPDNQDNIVIGYSKYWYAYKESAYIAYNTPLEKLKEIRENANSNIYLISTNQFSSQELTSFRKFINENYEYHLLSSIEDVHYGGETNYKKDNITKIFKLINKNNG